MPCNIAFFCGTMNLGWITLGPSIREPVLLNRVKLERRMEDVTSSNPGFRVKLCFSFRLCVISNGLPYRGHVAGTLLDFFANAVKPGGPSSEFFNLKWLSLCCKLWVGIRSLQLMFRLASPRILVVICFSPRFAIWLIALRLAPFLMSSFSSSFACEI